MEIKYVLFRISISSVFNMPLFTYTNQHIKLVFPFW